ncbi:hypothetical protein [Neisseria sp.]|uniref:hypothetical protein n=1 Tax=Neisseria sp. TaxID=192066 RepID=UPI0026DD4AA3|nr:hypothetical protein [Neisseria sp.]MDO4225938.1 hypothetical protein [Neisseria sp.]
MRLHIGSIIVLICGLTALIPGLMVLFGFGGWVHELLDQPIGAIALLVIGGSCMLAAFFPLLATYLTRREQGKAPFEEDGEDGNG